MEKAQKDHILRNLVALVGCTKNDAKWGTELLEKNFIDKGTLERIGNTAHDRDSRIREMYFECFRTPGYDLLIESLRNTDNVPAVDILNKYYGTSSSTTGSTNGGYNNFSVSENGIVEIRCILQNYPELKKDWVDVVPSKLKLSGESRGELMEIEAKYFGPLVLRTLRLWLKEKGKDARFKEIVDIIGDYLHNKPAKDALIEKWEDIRDA